MRWFLLSREAMHFTGRVLNSQQSYHHGCFGMRYLCALNSGGFFLSVLQQSPSPYAAKMQLSSLFFPSHFYLTESFSRDETTTAKKVDLQIVSIESVKPASPTPHQLRTFNLSIFDQMFLDFYSHVVLFLPNMDNTSVKDVITKRCKLLKKSLSELLTRYYPFAGEIKDSFHICCNDKGVLFIEARVNQTLKDFLHQPDDLKVRQLIPKHPSAPSANPVIIVQVNTFNCGGIALSTSLTHRIVDGHTYFMFMNAWAAAIRGSPAHISPSFVASELFPYNPSFKNSSTSRIRTTKVPSCKRFVFDSTAVASLKAQLAATDTPMSRRPTRVEVTGALIWKAVAKAASTIRPFSPWSPHVLVLMVNFRKRALPPLPNESIGNLLLPARAICFPDSQPELPTLMSQIRESIAKINLNLVDALRGKNGHDTFNKMLKAWEDSYDDLTDNGDVVFLTSLLNNGIYKIDFGWGKPIWFYNVNPGIKRSVSLIDTTKGGGVEAIVSLSPEEMEIFEHDLDVLSYTTVDPSPLQHIN